ncbi:SdpI family protein [Mycetocola zhujimingii]|uniref:SdpI family protein n=1 Tax=Mycetocola zhujimingii TaxID=2079792 RepID=UPI000D3AC862|nr:hypothetical protein C3E77_05185 [Mycetocola zhujimingii]
MFMAGMVLAFCAVLIVFVSESAARGHLGMNGMMGLRFGSLMSSDDAWEAGHRAARVPINIGAGVLFLAGILVIVMPLSDTAKGITVGVSMGIMLLLIAAGAFAASRAADRVVLEAWDPQDGDS